MSTEVLDAKKVAKQWRGYPETIGALQQMIEAGWEIRSHGEGHCRAYCPCGAGGAQTHIGGSPQNDGSHARRLIRTIGKCPDSHDLV